MIRHVLPVLTVALLVPSISTAEPRCADTGCEGESGKVVEAVQQFHGVPQTGPVTRPSEEMRAAVGLVARLADDRDPASLEEPSSSQIRRGEKRAVPVGAIRLVFPWEEPVDIQVYDELGAFQPEALTLFASYAGIPSMHDVEPRLLVILYVIARDFDRPIHVVSAYREAEQSAGLDAGHDEGRALDIYLDGIAAADLRDFCASRFEGIGLGYRPATGLVHIDVREQTIHWEDTARAGRTARERLVEVPALETADTTLETLHLSPAQLYPSERRPRDSELER